MYTAAVGDENPPIPISARLHRRRLWNADSRQLDGSGRSSLGHQCSRSTRLHHGASALVATHTHKQNSKKKKEIIIALPRKKKQHKNTKDTHVRSLLPSSFVFGRFSFQYLSSSFLPFSFRLPLRRYTPPITSTSSVVLFRLHQYIGRIDVCLCVACVCVCVVDRLCWHVDEFVGQDTHTHTPKK